MSDKSKNVKSKFPQKPVRVTPMDSGIVQYFFKGGECGSTKDPDDIKELEAIQSKFGEGTKGPKGKKKNRKTKPKSSS